MLKNFNFKLPEDLRQKFKLTALMDRKNMSEVLIDLITIYIKNPSIINFPLGKE